jgi:hypothetical protein
MAQARELLRLHAQAAAQAAQPPMADDSGGPFQAKPHTTDCIVTADFNFDPASAEYAVMVGDNGDAPRLLDCWRLVHGQRPHEPTFHLYDKTYSPGARRLRLHLCQRWPGAACASDRCRSADPRFGSPAGAGRAAGLNVRRMPAEGWQSSGHPLAAHP